MEVERGVAWTKRKWERGGVGYRVELERGAEFEKEKRGVEMEKEEGGEGWRWRKRKGRGVEMEKEEGERGGAGERGLELETLFYKDSTLSSV